MSKFIAAPRRWEDMMKRATVGDVANHPLFQSQVDLEDMPYFDPKSDVHLALADAVSDGVYRHGLLAPLLEADGRPVSDPLTLEFHPGLALTRVVLPDGEVVFERESGFTPKAFRPGRWILRFMQMQIEEDRAMSARARKEALESGSVSDKYLAVDDSSLFPDQRIGFLARRQVSLA